MGVEIPPPFLDLVVQVGDAVDDRHWRFPFASVFRGLRRNVAKSGQKSAQQAIYAIIHKTGKARGFSVIDPGWSP
jgi:hypothetical protein